MAAAAAAAPEGEHVYATLLLTDSYLPGALVLAHSLRDAGTTKKLAVFFTLDSVSAESVSQLQTVFDHVIPVPRVRNEHRANLYLMNRPDLDSAFTKINLWKQVQFSKIVYLDADVVAYRAPDELFTLLHAFGAAPDIGWPDLFNTGVMVLTPNLGDYFAMLAMAERGISFDGADQGLLNMYFKNSVHRLSFSYNVTPSSHYQYVPAYRHFQSSISMVHFIGSNKPWFEGRHAQHGSCPYAEMVGRWWTVYDRHYRAQETATTQSQPETSHRQHFARDEFQPPGQLTTQPASSGYTTPAAVIHDLLESRESDKEPHPRSDPIQSEAVHGEGFTLPPPQAPAHSERSESYSRVQSWDAQWQPPPPDSKPEAINFPATHYEMSKDAAPFVPPARYPSPPRNMWYEVPKDRPAEPSIQPKAIFPWEGHQPHPSRSFPAIQLEQTSKAEEPTPGGISSAEDQPESTGALKAADTPPDVKIRATSAGPWSSFTLSNAWDEVPEINKYVERVQGHRQRKSIGSQTNLGQPKSPGKPTTPSNKDKPSFQGLRLTDFPTEVERPSLPVTPAPIRRPSFWGDEGEEEPENEDTKDIPLASGVPMQSEWDPAEQLQKLAQQHSDQLLRRLSGSGEESSGVSRAIPSRSLPFGSETWRPAAYAEQPEQPEQPEQRVFSPTPIKGDGAATGLVRKMTGVGTEAATQSADTGESPAKSLPPDEDLDKLGL